MVEEENVERGEDSGCDEAKGGDGWLEKKERALWVRELNSRFFLIW